MKECPYTASSRDVSENTPPSALEISLVRGFCTPRPLGNLLGLGGCIFRYIPPLGSVRIQYARSYYYTSGFILVLDFLIVSTYRVSLKKGNLAIFV